jgi:uncharacterized membrane protein YbjE (DUF340 family)
MIEKMHDYLMKEMAQNKQVDTIFVILGIVFNLLMLAINSAAQSSKDYSLMIVFFILGILVTIIAVVILIKGKDTRKKLINGLLMMYDDNNVGKYFDKSIIKNDDIRSKLEIIAVIATGVTSIIIPIILKIVYKGEV